MRLNLFMLLLIVLAVSCKKDPSLWNIDNLEDGTIRVFGHGGMGHSYKHPMNSYSSLNDVLKLGAYGTEMDIQLTRDSVLVLYHDNELKKSTKCDGKIREHAWDEIKDCLYKLPVFSPEKIITLNEFFEKQGVTNYYFAFDCKVEADDDENYVKRFANKLYEIILKHNLIEHCFIESYNTVFLENLRAKSSKLKLFIHSDSYNDGLNATKQIPLYGIVIDKNNITKNEIINAHLLNLHVALFNVATKKENLEAIEMNPDFIQTDKCDFLINALK